MTPAGGSGADRAAELSEGDGTGSARDRGRPAWPTYLLLTVVAVIWGVTWPVGRTLATDAPLFATMALRYAVAVVLLFAWLRAREGVRLPPRDAWRPLAWMALTSVVLYQIFFMFGVQRTAASDAALVIATGPVITALLAVPLLAYRLNRGGALGLACGLAGVALIAWASPNEQIALRDRLTGDGLILGGALAYAAYTVALRRYFLGPGPRLSPLALLAWVSLLGWLALLPPALAERPWEFAWTADHALFIIYLGAVSTVLAYVFFAVGVARLGAPRAASFINLVPLFGVLTSWAWLGEAIGWVHLASFALVYAGVRLVNAQPPEGAVDDQRPPEEVAPD